MASRKYRAKRLKRFSPMIRSMIAACAAFGLAGTAMAGTAFTATLETPMTEAEQIVAAKSVWECADATCEAELNRKSATVRTCKQVVKEVGALAAFQSENGALSEEDLAKCNEVAKS